MPLYDFRCSSCQTVFEQRLSLAALDQPVRCPECGAAAERLVSLPAGLVRGASAAAAAPMGGT